MKFQMNRRRWLGLSLAGLAGAGALGALFAAPAFGGGRGFFGHGHGHGFGHHGRGRFDEEHIRDGVEWALRGIEASEQQIAEVTRIATATAQELHGPRDEHAGARAQILAALAGESVDRAALETLRSEHLAAAESASRKLTEAIVQIAEVLTPAQRAELAAEHERFHALHEERE
jgi:protein CpxP